MHHVEVLARLVEKTESDAATGVEILLDQNLFQFILYTFEKEDYWVSARIQEGLGRGQRTHAIFGRNELALVAMHRSYREAIGRQPDEVLTPL